MERRLAAIVSADIVGYSRLIDLDEAGTHGRVMALIEALKALVDAARRPHHQDHRRRRAGHLRQRRRCGRLRHRGAARTRRHGRRRSRRAPPQSQDRRQSRRHHPRGRRRLWPGRQHRRPPPGGREERRRSMSPAPRSTRRAARSTARFEPVGKVSLKNIAEPVEVFAAIPTRAGRIDPRPAPRRARRRAGCRSPAPRP